MADLPQYKSNAAIQPLAAPDYQSSAERLAGAFQDFANTSAQKGDMLAKDAARKAGEQAGSKPGFQPQKPTNEREMIFQNAAIQAQKGVVQMDIAQNLQRIRDQVLDPRNFGPGSLEKYEKLSQAYGEGALASVPKEILPSAKQYFDHYALQGHSAVNGRVDALKKNQMEYQLFDYINKMGKQAENEALSGETIELEDGTRVPAAAVTTGQINQKVQASVSVGLIPGQAGATLKQGYTDQAHEYFYLGQFSKLLNSDPSKAGDFINHFLHNKQIEMNPIERMKAVTKMHGMLNQYQLAGKMDETNLNLQMRSAIAGVANGEPLSSYNNTITQVQQLAPKKFDAFMSHMNAADFSATVGKAITYATPGDQERILAATKPKPLLANGEPDPYYADAIKVWHHMGDVARKVNKQWSDDPAKMAIQNPSVVQAFEDRNVAASGPSLTNAASVGKIQSTNTSTINPVQQMVNVQLQRGIPFNQVSILTKDGAAQMVASLKDMQLPDQVKTLNDTLTQYGPAYAPIVSRDLQNAGLEFTPLLLTAVANNADSKGSLADVTKAMQADPKDIEKTMPVGSSTKDVQKQVPAALGDWNAAMQQSYNGDTTQHRAQMSGAVKQYASWLIASGKENDPVSAAKTAADTLINNFYNYPKINGYKVALPKNVDSGLMRDAFTHLLSEAKKDNLQVPGLYAETFHTLTNDQLQSQYKSDSISQAHFAVEPGDTSAVLVDNQNTPIIDKNGKRYRVKFDELGNPLSDIRMSINNQKSFMDKVGDVAHYLDPSLFKDDNQ